MIAAGLGPDGVFSRGPGSGCGRSLPWAWAASVSGLLVVPAALPLIHFAHSGSRAGWRERRSRPCSCTAPVLHGAWIPCISLPAGFSFRPPAGLGLRFAGATPPGFPTGAEKGDSPGLALFRGGRFAGRRGACIIYHDKDPSVMRKAVIFLGLIAASQLAAQDIFTLASRGSPAQIQAARDAGANINSQDEKGRTPLMYAASDNADPGAAAAILRAGARIERPGRQGHVRPHVGCLQQRKPGRDFRAPEGGRQAG